MGAAPEELERCVIRGRNHGGIRKMKSHIPAAVPPVVYAPPPPEYAPPPPYGPPPETLPPKQCQR